MDVEFRHIEAFLAAARHGSFTRAAKSLHVSQPTFTVQIRQFEEALGVRLLDRNTRSVQLTPIGRDLLPVLERLLREMSAVLGNTKALSKQASGFVAVAALPSVSAIMLPSIIAKFRAAHPGVSIHLRDAVAGRVAAMVNSGEVDFGFGSVPANDPNLDFTPLFKDRMSAIFLEGCPLELKRSVSLKDLAGYPLILMDRDSSVRNAIDRGFASIGRFVQPVYEATYMSTALGMVKAGLGVTVLPSSVLSVQDSAPLLSRPVRRPDLQRDVGFICKRGRSLSRAAEEFRDAIRSACQSLS